jgi:hypothetical protein
MFVISKLLDSLKNDEFAVERIDKIRGSIWHFLTIQIELLIFESSAILPGIISKLTVFIMENRNANSKALVSALLVISTTLERADTIPSDRMIQVFRLLSDTLLHHPNFKVRGLRIFLTISLLCHTCLHGD